jgi:uncharacterized protein YjeT (DUF2065 family)
MESVEFAVGVTFLFLGISFIFRQGEWTNLILHMEKRGPRGILSLGVMYTIIGSFVLGFHWVWNGVELAFTVLGLIFLVRGFMCLTYPAWVLKKSIKFMKNSKANLRIVGLAMLILSGLILNNWWVVQYGWLYEYQNNLEFSDSSLATETPSTED